MYLTPVRPKLESASTVWNSITCTDAIQPESIQRKFAALCQYRFFTYDLVTYEDFLAFLSFVLCTTIDFILMQCFFLFLFIQVSNVARLLWILLLFDLLFVIAETLLCLLLLAATLSLQDAFRLLTMCVKTSIAVGNPLCH